ncbi:MAG: hypothetical protein N2486_02155 [Caloramator sp.]|nr:hypothetical protein [Caloramator sp.]
MIYPEWLVSIVGTVKHLEMSGKEVCLNIINNGNNNYISRINFYKELEVEYEENFNRYDSSGRFIEITKFDQMNSIDIVNKAIKIIKEHCDLDKNVLGTWNYCLFEIVDNVHNHADSSIDGYVVMQNYPRNREIRCVVLDAGKGIYESLSQSSKYRNITPEEALKLSLEAGVTRGYGRGNGLYHLKNFIVENNGELQIFSCGQVLKLSNKKIEVVDGPYWQGTLIYVRINTHNEVDLDKVFGEDIPTSVLEVDECIYDLW